MNQLHYKGYTGSVLFSEEDAVFHGKVLGISDSISFEGESVKTLTEDFQNAIDEYLDYCKSVDKESDKSAYIIQLTPELHSIATIFATQKGLPLNMFVEEAIRNNIAR